ncbi:MAG TPA: amidase [Solimonas sp.]
MNELIRRSATELCALLARGEVCAVEVVDAHLARIDAVNPALNALIAPRTDLARQEARDADARRIRGEPLPPLHGLPCTIKDSLDVAGLPSTFGIPARASHRATQDERHVARLRAAGAIVLGKTNVSQCLMYTEADNPLHGRTHHPWNPARSPGGSSGGEAALIAAGGSPLGLGTDIGGSVRVPAAFCGIASLKPTEGRLPDLGKCSVPPGQRAIPSQVGAMARTVADVALATHIANGETGDVPPLRDWRQVDLSQLRVGFYEDDGGYPVSASVRRAVREAATHLRDAGARVVSWQPPDVRQAQGLYGRLLIGDRGAGLRRLTAGGARSRQLTQLLRSQQVPLWLVPPLRRLLRGLGQQELAHSLDLLCDPATDAHWQGVAAQQAYRARFAEAMTAADDGPLDLILSPPCALPAFIHGTTGDLFMAGAHAVLYNLLGYPAGVVPVSRVRESEQTTRAPTRDLLLRIGRHVDADSAGLPLAVQVIARPWREDQALAAMAAVEAAARHTPDFPRTPLP